MKSFLIDIMTMMMPFMKPLVWLAALSFLASLALVVIGGHQWRTWARWTSAVTLAIGIFFLAAQGMGLLLGASPSINFGDASKFEFILVAFWKLGLASIGAWLIIQGLLRLGQKKKA
ncbi:hypothetical protein [Thermopetrobacter sp. TC1]|uniref:hypothetical protein n=1 Tax=Thermopetrobacter sp. TC1 TaxID=1495045 RepID=UPI00056FCF87|nr:hypothetical protein [Thermopetrobacter sp. TC1]